jgi:hypothetical protein
LEQQKQNQNRASFGQKIITRKVLSKTKYLADDISDPDKKFSIQLKVSF